jgi:hypothetical protein
MEDARFFRDQAVSCLQIVGQASDPKTAEEFLVAATRYFAQAIELEKRTELTGIQTRIGEELRTLFVVNEPSPERLLDLLLALDQPKDGESACGPKCCGQTKPAARGAHPHQYPPNL